MTPSTPETSLGEDRLSTPPFAVPEKTPPPSDAEAETTKRGFGVNELVNAIGPLIGLAVVFAFFSILRPSTFPNWNNVQNILIETAVVGTAALGMTMIIVSGGIDLSVGSSIALCTVSVATLLNWGVNHHLSPALTTLIAVVGGIGTGALCGLLISTLITRLQLSPFIVTLGMWGALRGVAKGLANEQTVQAPDTWLNSLLNSLRPDQKWMIFPPGVWMLLFMAILVALMLRYTRFGRHIFAIGSNENTARLCGVPVDRAKIGLYTLAAAFVGIAGILQFSYLTIGDPTTADGMELDIIAAVVIGGASLTGGQGSIFGSLIGAFIIRMVANGCVKLELSNWVQQIVTGVIIVFAVTLDRWRHRRAT